VVVKRGWILERCAEELARAIPDVTVNYGQQERTVDAAAAYNLYMPAKDLRKYPTEGRAIGFYTHGTNGFDLVDRFSACVAMNEEMSLRLGGPGGLGVELVTVIRPGIEHQAAAPVFGVAGRVYNDGRKGEALVKAAVRDGFTFIACGTKKTVSAMPRRQWPCPTVHRADSPAERAAFYKAINYLVVTSTEEGGPMTVPEAIAHGKPVIAPRGVGWCDEFPCLRYDRGSWDSLRALLQRLTRVPTWAEWVAQHRRLFRRLPA